MYGTTMENMRKRIRIRVVKNDKDFIKYTSRHTCVNRKVFGNNLPAVHEKKILLTLNKPICVGFTVLEIRKWEMYNFYYHFMKKKNKHFTLSFSDTDSLCYETNEDFYIKIYEHKDLFDLSNQPKNSLYLCDENRKVLSKMKD